MDEPVLKGWVWSIPFYPFYNNRYRTIKEIFWYDSSNELEFTIGYGKNHQILLPEHLIQSPLPDLEYVRANKDWIIRDKVFIIQVEPIMNIWSVVGSNDPRRPR